MDSDSESPRQTRARTPEAKDERRQAILQAALDEIFEHGFAAARMEDIAERAGVSKGTVYLYFPSKTAVFEGLVDAFARPNRERLEAVLAQPVPAIDRIRQMIAIMPALIRHSDMPKLLKILVSGAQTFPELIRGYRQSVVEPILAALERVVLEAQASGELRAAPAMPLVRLILAPMVASALWQITFETDPEAGPEARVDVEAMLELHADMLERALLADPAGE